MANGSTGPPTQQLHLQEKNQGINWSVFEQLKIVLLLPILFFILVSNWAVIVFLWFAFEHLCYSYSLNSVFALVLSLNGKAPVYSLKKEINYLVD